MGLEIAKAWVTIRANSSGLTRDFRKVKQSATKQMSGLSSSVASSLKHVSAALGVAGLAGAFVLATREAVMFQKAMVDVRANARLMGNQGLESFGKLNKVARELGKTTQFTAREAAGALNKMVLAGLSAAEATEAVPFVLNLAAAANLELAHAAKITVDNMRKFGMAAKDVAQISDTLVSAQSRAQITVSDLAQGLLTLGSISAAMNISFRDTVAVLTGMGRAGTEMSRAGTALAIALGRLARQPKEVADALDDMNININDFVLPSGAFEIIPLFRKIAETLPTTPVERGAQAMQLFGARGREILGVLNLMNRGRFIEKTAKGLDKDIGRAAKIATAKMNTFWGSLLKTKSALAEMAIAGLTPLIQALNPVLLALKDIIIYLGETGMMFGIMGKTIIEVATGSGNLGKIIVKLGLAYVALKIAMKSAFFWQLAAWALTNPVTMAAAVIGVGIIAAAYLKLGLSAKKTSEELQTLIDLEKKEIALREKRTKVPLTKLEKEAVARGKDTKKERDAKIEEIIEARRKSAVKKEAIILARAETIKENRDKRAEKKAKVAEELRLARIKRADLYSVWRPGSKKKEQDEALQVEAARVIAIEKIEAAEEKAEKKLTDAIKNRRALLDPSFWANQTKTALDLVVESTTQFENNIDGLNKTQMEFFRNMEDNVNSSKPRLEALLNLLIEREGFLSIGNKKISSDPIAKQLQNQIDLIRTSIRTAKNLKKVFGSVEKSAEFLGDLLSNLKPTKEDEKLFKDKLNALVKEGLDPAIAKEAFGESVFGSSIKPLEEVERRLKELTNGWDEATIAKNEYARENPFATPEEVQKFEKATRDVQKKEEENRKKEKAAEEKKARKVQRITDARSLTEGMMTNIERIKADLVKATSLFNDPQGLISNETYKRKLLEAKKQLAPKALMETGRVGFADFGKRIQDSILQRQNPLLQEGKKRTELLKKINENLGNLDQLKKEREGLVGGPA